MVVRPRAAFCAAGIALAAVACVACAPSPSDTAPPSGATTSVTAGPSPELDAPDVAADEISRAVFGATAGDGGIPETQVIATNAIVSGERYVVDAACVGTSVDYEILTAAVGDSGTTLEAGTVECGQSTPTRSSFEAEWSGVVQITLASTDDLTQAWVVVLPEE